MELLLHLSRERGIKSSNSLEYVEKQFEAEGKVSSRAQRKSLLSNFEKSR